MTREELNNISHFILKKDLFCHKSGDQVHINKSDGDVFLWVGGIKLELRYANDYEWLEPVTIQQYKVEFKKACIDRFMQEPNITEERAEELFKSMFEK